MQGQLIELEHILVLLKSLRAITLPSSPVLAHGIRTAQVSGTDPCSLSGSVSVQDKPILFFILPCI